MALEDEIKSIKLTFEGKFTMMERERIEKYINTLDCDSLASLNTKIKEYCENREFNFLVIDITTLICKRVENKKK